MLRARWRHLTPGLVPGVFICALLFPSIAAGAGDCRPTAELLPAKVRKVIDGDTLLLADGRRLRLIGINAPELGSRGRPDQPEARRARQLLRQRLPQGATVWLQPGAAPRDNYGRALAHLFMRRDGGSVEAALVSAGAALHVAIPPNLALTECLHEIEQQARRQGTGLWQHAQPLPVTSLDPKQGGFMRVKGRVVNVEESRHSWWFELDGPLVVRLDKRDLDHFEDFRPLGLLGQELIVRGWATAREQVETGRRPIVLPLRHPTMLELQSPG